MATQRCPPPTKQPSTPQPQAESSEDEEEEVESDEEERSGKQSQSKALDDEGDSEEGDDSGEEDSGSETEQPTLNRHLAATAVPTVPAPATPAVASDDDDDDEGGDSGESDSETEEEQLVPNPPAPRAATSGKPSNKDSAPEFGVDGATPLKAAPGKSSKKSVIRIWSDVDQLTLLKGMVDFIETEGKDPAANIEGFWLFIRKKLSFPVTECQLYRKIHAVKIKYRSNHQKNRAFSKAYETEVFKLSKKVWGEGEESEAVENGKDKKRKGVESVAVEVGGNDELEWENESINLSVKHIGLSEDLARAKIKSMAESQRQLLVQSWKKLKADEVSTLLRRTALEVDTMKTIF